MIPLFRGRDWLASGWLALVVLWAPLPFASVTPSGLLILRCAAFAALAVAVVVARRASLPLPVAVPVAAAAALATLALLQAASWPRRLAAIVSPEHVGVSDQTRLALGAGESAGIRLSLAPEVTRSTALTLLAVAALFCAAALIRRRGHRRLLASSLLAAALFQVLYGLRPWFAGLPFIWGVQVPGPVGRLRGTFVNPNHLAFYLEMALAIAFALVWWTWRRASRRRSLERDLPILAGSAALWLFLFTALAFTGSRAGLLGALAGAATQGLLLGWRRRRWTAALSGLAAAAGGLAVVGLIGYRQGLGRLLATSAYEITLGERGQIARAAIDLWQRYPWVGTGLGSFREAFSSGQPPGLGPNVWIHAHLQALELLVTGGVAAAVLAGCALAAVAGSLWRSLLAAKRSETAAAALAGLGLLASGLVHELFDFALTIPANAFTYAVLLGAAVAARGSEGRREPAPPRRAPL